MLFDLLAIDSPSGKEAVIAEFLEENLRTLGFALERDDIGNIYAKLAGTAGRTAEPMIMFNCHMDTVPSAVQVRPVVAETRLRTDGTSALGADDKAGIAAVLSALRTIIATSMSHPPLLVLFTVSEETGLWGARHASLTKLREVAYGYTLDASGPVGTVIVRAPSKYVVTATFHGRAAHAGFVPERGISAISMACRAVDRMKLLRIDEETTANVGSIHGGTSTNIVCDTATVVMETRSLLEEKVEAQAEHLRQCCLEAATEFGGTCEATIERLYFHYALAETEPPIQAVRTACEKLGIPFVTKPTTGGSDANVFNRAGIPVAVLSAGYRNAHSVDESLDLEQLKRLAALTLDLATARPRSNHHPKSN